MNMTISPTSQSESWNLVSPELISTHAKWVMPRSVRVVWVCLLVWSLKCPINSPKPKDSQFKGAVIRILGTITDHFKQHSTIPITDRRFLVWMKPCRQDKHHWPMTPGITRQYSFTLLQLHVWLRKQVTDCITVISLLGRKVGGCEFCTQVACQSRVPRDVVLKARHLAGWCIPAVHTHTRPIEHAATMPTGSLHMHFQYNKPLPSWC